MQPRFLAEMDEAFASRQHVILTLNTEDRFAFPLGRHTALEPGVFPGQPLRPAGTANLAPGPEPGGS